MKTLTRKIVIAVNIYGNIVAILITIKQISNQQYALAVEQAELKINDTKTQYSAQVNSKISEIDTQLIEIKANLEK